MVTRKKQTNTAGHMLKNFQQNFVQITSIIEQMGQEPPETLTDASSFTRPTVSPVFLGVCMCCFVFFFFPVRAAQPLTQERYVLQC